MCSSMRMTLDLLHEFAKTEVFCLFHNCMWQSRHSEVNVYFLALCEQTDGLSTFNGSPRSSIGFWVFGWVCCESSPPPAISEPNSFIQLSRKEIFGRGRGDAFSFSKMISPTISWDVCREDDGVRSCLTELYEILFKQVWCRLNTPCLDVSSTFCACTVQDAVLPGQLYPDLCVPCSLDPQTWRIPSVFCSNFVLPVSILNSWWSVNWLHLRCDKCTRRNRSELVHCPVLKDQWDCVLNDLEELGDKEFLVLTDQYNIEIFSCFLRLLQLYSPTCHPTNVEIAQDLSEDTPLIFRIQSLHHLLEVKKSTQLLWHWLSDWRIIFWLNINPRSFTDRYSSCGWAGKSTSFLV